MMVAARRNASRTVELLEMMLFVTCAKVWKQQSADGRQNWVAIGVIHPFVQIEPTPGVSPGDALFAAYTAWKQQNP